MTTIPLPDASTLLSQEDVDNLPEGTEVYIKWSGGNGPHRYTIGRCKDWLYAYVPKPEWCPIVKHLLDFVGKERWHTKVWLA